VHNIFVFLMLFTGIKMWFATGEKSDLDNNPALKWTNGRLKITRAYGGGYGITCLGLGAAVESA